MTNAEQWLSDLEAKAKAAIDTAGWGDMDWSGAHEDFFYAANPATVLRLVNMVRWLAEGCDCDADTCLPGCTPQCVLEKAYAATGERHE